MPSQVVDKGFFPVKCGIVVTCYVIGWSRALDVRKLKHCIDRGTRREDVRFWKLGAYTTQHDRLLTWRLQIANCDVSLKFAGYWARIATPKFERR